MPQNTTSASSTVNPVSSAAVRRDRTAGDAGRAWPRGNDRPVGGVGHGPPAIHHFFARTIKDQPLLNGKPWQIPSFLARPTMSRAGGAWNGLMSNGESRVNSGDSHDHPAVSRL